MIWPSDLDRRTELYASLLFVSQLKDLLPGQTDHVLSELEKNLDMKSSASRDRNDKIVVATDGDKCTWVLSLEH